MTRVDLSGLDELGRLARGLDVDGLVGQLQSRFAPAEQFHRQSAELVGRAESADGLIAATWNAVDGLQELTLDPRAMRMSSVDLAAEVVAVTVAACADLGRQRDRLSAQFGPEKSLPDPEALRAVGHAYAEAAGGVQALMDRFRNELFGR